MREIKQVNYENMTESERNELIAYTAAMAERSKRNLERSAKILLYLLVLLSLNLCEGIAILLSIFAQA